MHRGTEPGVRHRDLIFNPSPVHDPVTGAIVACHTRPHVARTEYLRTLAVVSFPFPQSRMPSSQSMDCSRTGLAKCSEIGWSGEAVERQWLVVDCPTSTPKVPDAVGCRSETCLHFRGSHLRKGKASPRWLCLGLRGLFCRVSQVLRTFSINTDGCRSLMSPFVIWQSILLHPSGRSGGMSLANTLSG